MFLQQTTRQLLALYLVTLSCFSAVAATPPLTIVSPPGGTIIKRGSSLSVTVDGVHYDEPVVVALKAENADFIAEDSRTANSVDQLTFLLPIPKNARSGPALLVALAPSGVGTNSSPRASVLSVYVEGPEIIALRPEIEALHFSYLGAEVEESVYGDLADGHQVRLNHMNELSTMSADANIAMVDKNSDVRAIGTGSTFIRYKYQNPSGRTVEANVRVYVSDNQRHVSPP